MASWQLSLTFDPSDPLPPFLRIVRAISTDILRGRLQRGQRMPSSRVLAGALGLHRNTTLRAYAELSAEGWLTTETGRGTFVSSELPIMPRERATARLQRRSHVARLGYPLRPPPPSLQRPSTYPTPVPEGTASMVGGLPDVGLVPSELLARAYRRALRADAPRLLDYGNRLGHLRLRRALVAMLAVTRSVVAETDDVLVTQGSQMAIYLLARALIQPGDVVVVEAFGYRPAWEAFRLAGAELLPIRVDRDGLCVDELRCALETRTCRAVYLTPHHQYPTGAALSQGRRLELLELAVQHRLAIVEDDYDHEFHYDGRPILPMASADTNGVVAYVGTLSKILAPGLRIGYVVAHRALIERMASYRACVDHQGDLIGQAAVAELLEDEEVQRHVQRVRRLYRTRRDLLGNLIEQHLSDALRVERPRGGLAFWLQAAKGIDVDAWAERALKQGVAITTARRYAFDGKNRPFVRVGFGRVDEEMIERAVRVFVQTRP